MTSRICRWLLLAPWAAAPVVAAQDEALGPLDVAAALALSQVANPMLGSDFVAFSRIVPRPLADGPGGSYQHLGVIAAADPTAAPRWLVSGRDSALQPAVQPGRRAVSWLARTDRGPQVVVQSLDGGDPALFAATPPIASYRWRPDGKALAFTSLDPPPPARAVAQAGGFRQVVVDEDWRHLSLFVVESGQPPRRLTDGVTVFAFEWSPDGRRLACGLAPRNLVDDSYMATRLWLIDDLDTGARKPLVENPGKLGEFAWSPDGRRVAYIGAQDRNDPHAGMLWSVDVESRAVESHTHGFQGMVQALRATDAGFVAVESIGVRTRLRWFDAAVQPVAVFEPREQRLAIEAVAAAPDRHVFVAGHARHPPELFLLAAPEAVPVRWTASNPGLERRTFGEQRVVRFRARDGLPIEGVLILPVGHRDGDRHPLVVVVHGGPEAHFTDGWLSTYGNLGQLLAARGFVSWYPNYRASTGYGVAFCKQDHGDPMGREFEDHLDAIDHLAAAGLIDDQRVGILGGSYGGYTAAWAATRHSPRFAAAVSFVPFVDLRSKWLTSDIPFEFYHVHYQEQWPWEQPGLMHDRSPLTWVERCRTPLLLLGGTEDTRVHPSQPLMLYRGVRLATTTPVRYVQYPGEGHGNRTNVYRLDFALRALQWFDHYLKGDGERRTAPPPPLDLDYPQ